MAMSAHHECFFFILRIGRLWYVLEGPLLLAIILSCPREQGKNVHLEKKEKVEREFHVKNKCDYLYMIAINIIK